MLDNKDYNNNKFKNKIQLRILTFITIALILSLSIVIINYDSDYYVYTFVIIFLILAVHIVFFLYLKKSILNSLQFIAKSFEQMTKQYTNEDFANNRNDEIGYLKESFNKLRNKMLAVEKLAEKINVLDNFEDVFDYLFDNFHPFIPYERIGIAVLNKKRTNIFALKAQSKYPIILGNKYSAILKDTTLNKIIKTGEPRIINDLEEYLEKKPSSDSTRLIVEEGMKSSITLPLKLDDDCVGVIFFSSNKKNTYNTNHLNFLKSIAQTMAISFEKNFVQQDLVVSTINGLAKLVESKDNETGLHIDRMRNYAYLIATKLGTKERYEKIIDNNFVEAIYNFSPLHDIGKVGIPDNILLKPDKLSNEEFDVMKTHTMIGAEILADMENEIKIRRKSFYDIGIQIVKYHHEKYDGTGYPEGLSGENIPLSARIVAIADVFDALTSERPYKEAFSFNKAVNILKSESGTHFDPYIIDVFLESKNEIKDIYTTFKELEDKDENKYGALIK